MIWQRPHYLCNYCAAQSIDCWPQYWGGAVSRLALTSIETRAGLSLHTITVQHTQISRRTAASPALQPLLRPRVGKLTPWKIMCWCSARWHKVFEGTVPQCWWYRVNFVTAGAGGRKAAQGRPKQNRNKALKVGPHLYSALKKTQIMFLFIQ